MENLLGKIGINGKLRANFGAIVILALGVYLLFPDFHSSGLTIMKYIFQHIT